MTTSISGTSGIVQTSSLSIPGLTLTGSPAHTASVTPAFSAYQSSSQTGITSGVVTLIQFQTKEFDITSVFNNTNATVGSVPAYAFMPLVAGYYQVNASGAWNGGYSFPILLIYKNGVDYKDGQQPSIAYRSTVNAIVYLNGSTDYIQIYGIQSSGSAGSLAAAINYTYFQAALIAAV